MSPPTCRRRAWRLGLGGDDASLLVRACVRCCEIDACGSAGIIYWDGPATVHGTWQDTPTAFLAECVLRRQSARIAAK